MQGFILLKKMLNLIPKNKKFDADQWIKLIIKNKFIAKVYPVPDNSWLDLGNLDNFINEATNK